MPDNPFAQFDTAASPAGANPFAQFDAPSQNTTTPQSDAFAGAPFAKQGATAGTGAMLGEGAFTSWGAPRLMAGAAALKESLSGGLPFNDAYNQALSIYQNAFKQQHEEQPVASAVENAAGSIPTLFLGGEAINAGLRSAGPAGRFLTGETDVPQIARDVAGRFRGLTNWEKFGTAAQEVGSKLALAAREGGQAGAYGAANAGEDVGKGAANGAMTGGLVGAVAPVATWGLGKLASAPAVLAEALPPWARHLAELGGLAGGVTHGKELLGAAAANPLATAIIAGGAGAIGAGKFLSDHPELQHLLTRLGILGYGSAVGSGAAPGLLGQNR